MRSLSLAVAALAFGLAPLTAHDYARPELAPWFMSLKSKGGAPCCDGKDATHLSDAQWRTAPAKDGTIHYQVFLSGAWRDVPPDAVVDGPNKEGTALVWPFYLNGEPVGVRCFMPGAGS